MNIKPLHDKEINKLRQIYILLNFGSDTFMYCDRLHNRIYFEFYLSSKLYTFYNMIYFSILIIYKVRIFKTTTK